MNDQAAQVVPVVVVLPAEIDVTNSEEVYEQLVAAFTPGVSTVIADMTSTIFCDSSGVHAIMHAYESAAARDVRLRLAVSPASSGSMPKILVLGFSCFTAAATPLSRPPPETGETTRSTSGSSSTISNPQVPCPAMICSSS